jgi:hypothetical protein
MPRSPDKLAFALSAAARTARPHYKHVFDHLLVTDATSAGIALDEAIDDLRRETSWSLDALGVCEFSDDGSSIYSLPPALALIPRSGLPTAILIGGRTPALLVAIRTAARKFRSRIIAAANPQPAFPLLPRRHLLAAESVETLREFAKEAHLPLLEVPLAHAIFRYSASVDDYIAQLQWIPHYEPDWTRLDFNTSTCTFSSTKLQTVRRLTKYSHPTQAHRHETWLIDGERRATVDRNWGRLAVMRWDGICAFDYDTAAAEVRIPVTVPLPRLYARGLVSCSGFAPVIRDLSERRQMRSYVDIPPEIAALLRSSLLPDTAPHRGLHGST